MAHNTAKQLASPKHCPLPPCVEDLTPEELSAMVDKALKDVREGRGIPAEQAYAELERAFGL